MAPTDDAPARGKRVTYRDAGVDIDAQDEALRRIKSLVASTRTAGVLSELGSFGGLFALGNAAEDVGGRDAGAGRPVLVSSCDGVGTKLLIAFRTGVHDTVGRDLVHHCVNDILVQGATPLFFMDYVATGRLDPAVLVQVVEGIARGCRATGCALLGGETAEMPGFYGDGEYDVAGFIVGLADRSRLLTGEAVQEGDVLVGLASAGLHTNGYSLARAIAFDRAGLGVRDVPPGLDRPLGELLLAEHRCYLGPLRGPLARGDVHALAHVTGGGLTDNLPRVLPDGLGAKVVRRNWPVPPLFEWLQRTGDVDTAEMYRVFNMGVGMVAVVPPRRLGAFEASLDGAGEAHWRIGEVVRGRSGVAYE